MKSARFLVVTLGLAGLIVAADAGAATTSRQIAVAGAHVPRLVDHNNWNNDSGRANVSDAVSATNYHYARMSIPIDLVTFSTTYSVDLGVQGGPSGLGQICMAVYSVSRSGTISAFITSSCTAGIGDTVLNRTISVGPNTAILVDMGGQNGASAKYLSYTVF